MIASNYPNCTSPHSFDTKPPPRPAVYCSCFPSSGQSSAYPSLSFICYLHSYNNSNSTGEYMLKSDFLISILYKKNISILKSRGAELR